MFNQGDRVIVTYPPVQYYGQSGRVRHVELQRSYNSMSVEERVLVEFEAFGRADWVDGRFLQLFDQYAKPMSPPLEQPKQEIKKIMDKFYRVKKDTYFWTAGAILKLNSNGKYEAVDDIWNVDGNEVFNKCMNSGICEKAELVENAPDWFERVYKVSSLRGMSYVIKDKMKELMSKTAVNSDGKIEDEEIPPK
jgi:hypothetical protein